MTTATKPVFVPNPLAHPGQYAAIDPKGTTTRDGTDHTGPVIRMTGHDSRVIRHHARSNGWWFGFRESDGRGHSHYRITDRFDPKH